MSVPGRCIVSGCGHAASMHNSLGRCRSRTTSDRSGECMCETFDDGTAQPLTARPGEPQP